ncbi:RsmB/NOP family class I SAM-dependent RNA methyltransferase [Ruminococcus sp. OA3]|nr:RsmB/NOP family class I SAM-dependent RNA methyltransferase [Ruminococcus sp. OA3]
MLGGEYQEFIKSYDEPRQFGLRVNTLKISPREFEAIAPFSITPVPWVPNGYFYREEDMPSRHPYYFAGLYYLQEPSAMTPASRLPVEKGDRVLDLCAAPGGKATELGALVGREGLLVANEINASRAKALLKNIEMMGIENAFITNEKPGNLSRCFEAYFDKILVDAPCSGEGMFRKEPEVAAVWDESRPAYFAKLQRDILDNAVKMLKPGGMLLYSTCTFSSEENEGSISRLLADHKDMNLIEIEPYEGFSKGNPVWGDGNVQLEKCVRIWPHKMRGEGHFMALLKKDGILQKNSDYKIPGSYQPFSGMEKSQRQLLETFCQNVKTERFTAGIDVRGEKVYKVPEFGREVKGLRFLRNGLYLGDLKKNRFEPQQPFAMALRRKEFESVLTLSVEDERVERYLKGETIFVEAGECEQKNGWKLVCVESFSLGWGKLVNGVLKNKYLCAWRKN